MLLPKNNIGINILKRENNTGMVQCIHSNIVHAVLRDTVHSLHPQRSVHSKRHGLSQYKRAYNFIYAHKTNTASTELTFTKVTNFAQL